MQKDGKLYCIENKDKMLFTEGKNTFFASDEWLLIDSAAPTWQSMEVSHAPPPLPSCGRPTYLFFCFLF